MQSLASAQSTTIRLPTEPLNQEKRKIDRLLQKLEKPITHFQKLSENHDKRKRSFDEMSKAATTSEFRARVIGILASRQLLGFSILPTEECADLLNVIPMEDFQGIVEDIYNSCQQSSFIRAVQEALNFMRIHWKNYSLERITFLNKYPVFAFVPDVLTPEDIKIVKQKIKSDLINRENPGLIWKIKNLLCPCDVPEATDRKPIFAKRFALSIMKKEHELQLSMIDTVNPRKFVNLEGYEPVIESSLLAFVQSINNMGINVTQNMMGVQAFFLHGHVCPNETFEEIYWHRDQTAFGIPDYIMVLMLGDRHGDRGWKGGEFWCSKGDNINQAKNGSLVKLNTDFNQGIILKNNESYHFVSEVVATKTHSAVRDILILDLYLDWRKVVVGLLTPEENDAG